MMLDVLLSEAEARLLLEVVLVDGHLGLELAFRHTETG
jgi:hypothetical protein